MKQIYFFIIYFCLSIILFACNSNKSEQVYSSLNLINSYKLNVAEPSGLSFASGNLALYVVSDNSNKVYKISFEGEILAELSYVGSDLEGICYDSESSSIWIAEERDRKIVNLDLQGNIIKVLSVNVDIRKENKGIEGISINSKTGNLFVLNESNPSVLLKLGSSQQILKEYSLNFANDYSGVFYDELSDNLWIISDESSTLTKCDLEGNPLETFRIGINKAEGIVVDSKNNKIYIVSDSDNKLYVYSF